MLELIIFVAVVLLGLACRAAFHRKTTPRFRKKPVLTGSELEFFQRLREALPECTISTQMAPAALIEPVGIGKLRQAAIACLEGKRVGYAVFDEEMQLMAVFELNYRSRPTRRESAVDACFKSAGVRVVRFQARHLPSRTKIRSALYERSKAKASGGVPALTDNSGAVALIAYSKPKTPSRNTVNAHI